MKRNPHPPSSPSPADGTSASLPRSQQAVLDMLAEQGQPCSAQQLYRLLRRHQSIALATVYRALEGLKRKGFVHSRASIHGELLYSLTDQEQHYLTCLHCGQSFPLERCPIEGLAQVQPSVEFKIYYHTLEFFGLCEPCSQRAKPL